MDANDLELCNTCGAVFHAGYRSEHQIWHEDLPDDIIDAVLKELDARAEAEPGRAKNLESGDSGW